MEYPGGAGTLHLPRQFFANAGLASAPEPREVLVSNFLPGGGEAPYPLTKLDSPGYLYSAPLGATHPPARGERLWGQAEPTPHLHHPYYLLAVSPLVKCPKAVIL